MIQMARPPSAFRWELRALFISKTESLRFDHLAVMDQHRLLLHAGKNPKSISRIQPELDEITKKRVSACLFRHGAGFGRPDPFNPRGGWIDEGGLEPVRDDLLVIGRIRPMKLRIGADLESASLPRGAAHSAESQHNQQCDGFHSRRD